jgi:hypothetical protein
VHAALKHALFINRISREWRLKIENWLQANEQDDKLNEDYRRKMKRMSNRRTLENDAGKCLAPKMR